MCRPGGGTHDDRMTPTDDSYTAPGPHVNNLGGIFEKFFTKSPSLV